MPLTIDYRPIALPAEVRELAPAAALAALGNRKHFNRAGRARSGAVATAVAFAAIALMGFDGAGLWPSPARASATQLQPFERAGENFPGSAFYYLDRDSGVVAPGASSVDRPEPLDPKLADAVAHPTFLAGTAEDRFRALHCLTTAIYYEAATEPDAGQRAVAQVVLNRVAHPQWPNSVCGVVYQGSERPGCQFSFACDGSMARAPARMWWLRARAVAEKALAGEVYAPVGLATYYHTGAVHPAWADRMTFLGAIGAHLFYRPPGAGGVPAAFTDRYWGGEPSPAPRPRLAPSGARDPLAEAATLGGSIVRTTLPQTVPAAVAPFEGQAQQRAGDALPAGGQARPEYRNSGRWIASPAG